MTNAVVSIIMPVYNGERFIAKAIDSVLAQSHRQWEVIIINDGSTDSTATVVAQFTDTRIHCIHQENMGLAGARNTGINAAKGKFLAFLDADDEWVPRFLERCVSELMSDGDLVGVYTFNYHIDQDGLQLPRPGAQFVSSEAMYQRLLEGGFFPPCAVVMRTQVVIDVGLFDSGLQGQGTEDWDLWLRVTNQYTIRCIPEPLALYRIYPSSMSTNAGLMHANRMAVLTKHFGAPAGDPSTWSASKRRGYAFAFRTAALGYIAQQEIDEGWRYFAQGVETEPLLLQRLDTFYELALGDQPRGYRGEARKIDIATNGAEMLRWLDVLFASASAPVQAQKSATYANAHLALAMLNDQAGDWYAARRHLRQAVKSDPGLLCDTQVVRRWLKLLAGRRLAGGLGRLRPDTLGDLPSLAE